MTEDPPQAGKDAEDAERKPGVPPHQPPLDSEEGTGTLDEMSEESFPSSDPPAGGGPGV